MKLRFDLPDHEFATSLSAAVLVGQDLWLGGDEGTKLLALRAVADSDAMEKADEVDLRETFDLPGKAEHEVDLEGIDWDPTESYLWMIGSHSLKRKAAKPGKTDVENLRRLGEIEADGNRFLLGRIPLRVIDGKSQRLARHEESADHFAARLDCTDTSSALLDALRDDPILGPIVASAMPGKDNGVDIEGLAWDVQAKRLLAGLRGPVLRGMTVILELEIEQEFRKDKVGLLHLRPIGPEHRLYLRHFLDLDGLAVRDICFDGPDLLILAGPTQPIDWPLTVYRWTNARDRGNSDRFWWQQGGAAPSRLERVVEQPLVAPVTRGHDRPEALTPLGGGRFLVVCDSPSESRFRDGVFTADTITLP